MAENQGNETGKGAKRQRRQFSAVEKRRLLDETEKPGESVSTVARRYRSFSLKFARAAQQASEAP
jgi:transposase-like protein